MPDDLFYANGLNADTGDYAYPPMDLKGVAEQALAEVFPKEHVQELLGKWFRVSQPDFAPADDDLDPRNLADVGWGVVYPHGIDPEIPKALAPLVEHRKAQASARSDKRFRVFDGPAAYRAGETALQFLARKEVGPVGPGPVAPDKVPMYLLLVGGPEEIPFPVQYQLDVEYAVGRLHFDTPAEYARYAAAVVAAETKPARPRRVVMTGTRHPEDTATEQSADLLVAPLAAHLTEKYKDWATDYRPPDRCRRADLLGVFAADQVPGLLFTATHGMIFPYGDPRQRDNQGALVCQDWPGREGGVRPIPPEQYLCAADLPQAACDGLVAFLFACHGAGTPALDDYPHPRLPAPAEIAARPFVSRLGQRLLGQGAAAVVGHVDRAWPTSFVWQNSGAQRQVFESVFQRLLRGQPVGWAFDKMNVRYAELASYLKDELADLKYGKVPDLDFGYLWTATNDCRGYVVLGDPAARVSVPPAA
jgi:hypothetical protein